MTLRNQKLHYICKCSRITVIDVTCFSKGRNSVVPMKQISAEPMLSICLPRNKGVQLFYFKEYYITYSQLHFSFVVILLLFPV